MIETWKNGERKSKWQIVDVYARFSTLAFFFVNAHKTIYS